MASASTEDDAACDHGRGKSDEAVGDGHVRMHVVQSRNDHGADDAEQQADGKRDERADERHQQDAHRNRIPARWARGRQHAF